MKASSRTRGKATRTAVQVADVGGAGSTRQVSALAPQQELHGWLVQIVKSTYEIRVVKLQCCSTSCPTHRRQSARASNRQSDVRTDYTSAQHRDLVAEASARLLSDKLRGPLSAAMSKVLRANVVRHLELSVKLSGKLYEQLAAGLASNISIEVLSLAGSCCGDAALAVILPALHNHSKLQVLELPGCGATDVSAHRIAHLLKAQGAAAAEQAWVSGLRSTSVPGNPKSAGPTVAPGREAAEQTQGLHVLDLSQNQITGAALPALTAALAGEHCSLRHINLARNQLPVAETTAAALLQAFQQDPPGINFAVDIRGNFGAVKPGRSLQDSNVNDACRTGGACDDGGDGAPTIPHLSVWAGIFSWDAANHHSAATTNRRLSGSALFNLVHKQQQQTQVQSRRTSSHGSRQQAQHVPPCLHSSNSMQQTSCGAVNKQTLMPSIPAAAAVSLQQPAQPQQCQVQPPVSPRQSPEAPRPHDLQGTQTQQQQDLPLRQQQWQQQQGVDQPRQLPGNTVTLRQVPSDLPSAQGSCVEPKHVGLTGKLSETAGLLCHQGNDNSSEVQRLSYAQQPCGCGESGDDHDNSDQGSEVLSQTSSFELDEQHTAVKHPVPTAAVRNITTAQQQEQQALTNLQQKQRNPGQLSHQMLHSHSSACYQRNQDPHDLKDGCSELLQVVVQQQEMLELLIQQQELTQQQQQQQRQKYDAGCDERLLTQLAMVLGGLSEHVTQLEQLYDIAPSDQHNAATPPAAWTAEAGSGKNQQPSQRMLCTESQQRHDSECKHQQQSFCSPAVSHESTAAKNSARAGVRNNSRVSTASHLLERVLVVPGVQSRQIATGTQLQCPCDEEETDTSSIEEQSKKQQHHPPAVKQQWDQAEGSNVSWCKINDISRQLFELHGLT